MSTIQSYEVVYHVTCSVAPTTVYLKSDALMLILTYQIVELTPLHAFQWPSDHLWDKGNTKQIN